MTQQVNNVDQLVSNATTNFSWTIHPSDNRPAWDIADLSPLFALIYAAQTLVGFLGNFVAIWVLSKMVKSSSTPTNYCMLNLSIADWVFSTLVVPVIAQTLCYPQMSPWKLINSNILCKIFIIYQTVVVFVSIFTMILMTVDRYLAVVHPIATMGYRNPRNTIIALMCIWAVSVLFSLPQFYMGQISEATDHQCYINWTLMQHKMHIPVPYLLKFFAGFTFVFTYLIPLSVIVIIYYRIIKVLRQREAARFRNPGPSICPSTVAHAAVVNGATASAAQRMQQSIAETNIDGNELADKTENGPKKPLKMRFRKISRERRRRTERLSEQALAVRRRNERTTKLVMIIVMVFAVCIFPMQVQTHILAVDEEQFLYKKYPFMSELLMRLVYMCFFLNSIVNPFVYTFQCQPFKEAMRESIPKFMSNWFHRYEQRRQPIKMRNLGRIEHQEL